MFLAKETIYGLSWCASASRLLHFSGTLRPLILREYTLRDRVVEHCELRGMVVVMQDINLSVPIGTNPYRF